MVLDWKSALGLLGLAYMYSFVPICKSYFIMQNSIFTKAIFFKLYVISDFQLNSKKGGFQN